MAFLTAIGLTATDAYAPATTVIGGTTWYYYESDTLINALRGKLDSNSTEVKNALENVAKTQGGTAMPETDAYGHSEARNLELGLYLVVETRVPEDVVNTTAPFFASLPMTTIDGSEWNYDLVLYPKNATGFPTLEKTLRESKEDTGKNNGTQDIYDGYAPVGTASDGDVIGYVYIGTDGRLYCVYEFKDEIEVFHTPAEILEGYLRNNIPIGVDNMPIRTQYD